jgi:hypothetical protein
MTRKDAARRRYLTVQVVDRTHRIVAPIIRMTESKPKSTPLRLVISTPSPKAAVDLSGEIAPVPILLEKLERLEQAMKDLSTEVQQRGGIAAAGKVVERRIMAVVNRLWSLADHPPVRRMS